MPDNAVREKEWIQILLAEYNGLRAEINARMSSVYQVATITALVAVFLLQQQDRTRLGLGLLAGALGLGICAWAIARDLVRAALRLKELEREINALAGRHLMVWETEWGGQTSSLWSARILRILLRLNRPPYSK